MPTSPIVDIEGLVYVEDWESYSVESEAAASGHITIDEMVARAVEPEMLEDEPQVKQLLLRFRQRLITALEHVNHALKTVSQD